MLRRMKKSKIHRATVTDANLNYQGSITIDKDIMDAADILVGEQVQVVNINNGSRAETYTIEGERGSGTICMNGAIARLAQKGDLVIIISYADYSAEELKDFKSITVKVDETNKITERYTEPS
ncbi:MAG: aspartate 1-decarboxylase [Candidatus Delongbacteria bacterium]|nr:aspartate 1-decarboxylase [Candidatus Delongbacteria bacterium]MDD4205487.1 aspartate 1-decarboxylase [Candidatus Delongbacteria bacterium]MDY0017216.1 aspartate 1-decarboxylase [Candidatus Delongbacteria bacterium]